MDTPKSSQTHTLAQLRVTTDINHVAAILNAVDPSAIIERLKQYRTTGRKGYPLIALWKAYLASFILNLPHTNGLIRRLQSDDGLRTLCGFQDQLPHRTTFNRFIARLRHHTDLIEDCLTELTNRLRRDDRLKDLGRIVAVDSTTIRTHSAPFRKPVSDPEASWTGKNHGKSKTGKDWYFGYKLHLVSDAVYGVPLAGYLTTASKNDSPELPRLLNSATNIYPWFNPSFVICDRGYDSAANHQAVKKRGAVPIIGIRRTPSKPNPRKPIRGQTHTHDGAPICTGLQVMSYIRSDPKLGHLYRCPPDRCRLKNRKGVRYCHDEQWELHKDNPRLESPISRKSQKWKDLYRLRQSIERIFKSLKESRRLERHCVRGSKRIALHSAMTLIAYQATIAVHVNNHQTADMRWMVNRID